MQRKRSLSERERFVLDCRYGLSSGESRTHSDIGQSLGLTRQRVEQIESEAIDKIRKHIEKLDGDRGLVDTSTNSRHARKRRNFCRPCPGKRKKKGTATMNEQAGQCGIQK